MTKAIGRRRHVRDLGWLRARVQIDPQTDCWVWTGVVNHRGYGRYHYTTDEGVLNGSAHRLALELFLGRPLLAGMNACHRCDNPSCCNGEHLFEGTTADNLNDCRAKGRDRHRSGERHGMARLRQADVDAIRVELATGRRLRAIAAQFGVSQTTISNIKTGKAWKRPG